MENVTLTSTASGPCLEMVVIVEQMIIIPTTIAVALMNVWKSLSDGRFITHS